MKEFRLTKEETASLCASLAHLLEAGLPPGDGLVLLAQDEKQPRLREKLQAMAARLDGGSTLHQAFEEAGCFDSYVCRLLEVGERVGKAVQTLGELARYYRERGAMERRLRSALIYPAALLGVLVGVVCLLLIWVMPIFQEVYAGMGSSLQGLAGYLLAFGQGLGKALPWLGLGVLLILAVSAIPKARKAVKNHFADRGPWKDVNSARYLQALSLGLDCGLGEQESARLAAPLAKASFARRCADLQQRLAQGQTLGSALGETDFLTAGDRRLLEAARRSGHAEQALQAIAQESARRSEEALERRLGRIEPIMVALACGLVALVLLSVMVPLVSIMNTLG